MIRDELVQSVLDALDYEPDRMEMEQIEALCAVVAGEALPNRSSALYNARRAANPLGGIRTPQGAVARIVRTMIRT